MAVVPGEMRNRLHIATVHWQRPDWIEPQLRYLRRFAPPDTKVWASLDGIDQEHGAGFDYTTTLEGRHADKLNELAHRISREADPGDQLLFLDGDAFPIAPLAPLLAAPDRLIAVRRDEKDEKQPHPCFALTSVGFWNEINGDWSHGYVSDGGHIDVGGELLRSLTERGLRWRALTRLNTVNLIRCGSQSTATRMPARPSTTTEPGSVRELTGPTECLGRRSSRRACPCWAVLNARSVGGGATEGPTSRGRARSRRNRSEAGSRPTTTLPNDSRFRGLPNRG